LEILSTRTFAALVSLAVVTTAHAENEEVIARCATTNSLAERVLCLEDALRGPPVELAATIDDAPAILANEVMTDSAVTENAEAKQFGLTEEQLEHDPVTSVDVVVVKISKNAYGKLIFTTDNGQIWQQTDQRSARYRDLPVDAIIRSGASGSFFIQPRAGGIASRVKRLK